MEFTKAMDFPTVMNFTTVFALVITLIAVITVFKGVQIVPQQSVWIVERLGKYDRKLEPGWQLHRQVSGLGPLKDAVDVDWRTPPEISDVDSIGNQPARGDHESI